MTGRQPNQGDGPSREANNDAFVRWLEGIPDPRERYRRATEELERHQQAMERLSSLRASAAADAYASGETIRALAEEFGVSPSRIHQIIETANTGAAEASGPKRRPRRKKGDKR
jgi:DNA-directed RNA polymerase specialized sigma24 family protein